MSYRSFLHMGAWRGPKCTFSFVDCSIWELLVSRIADFLFWVATFVELPHTKVLIYYCKSRYPEVTCSQNHWVSTSRSGGCTTQNIKLNTWEWFVRRVEVAAHQHALFSNVAYNVWESISGRIILLLLLQFVAFGSLKHTPKLIVCRNLQHAWGTCMQNLWFSILIYHTWQAAAHQHIDCFL